MKGKLVVFAVALLLAAAIVSVAAAIEEKEEKPKLVIQEFIGDPHQLTDITDNPMQAGIKVIRDNERITLENKNKRFILVVIDTGEFFSEAVLIAPNQTRQLYTPSAKVVTIAYPRQEYIRGGPIDYYFKFY